MSNKNLRVDLERLENSRTRIFQDLVRIEKEIEQTKNLLENETADETLLTRDSLLDWVQNEVRVKPIAKSTIYDKEKRSFQDRNMLNTKELVLRSLLKEILLNVYEYSGDAVSELVCFFDIGIEKPLSSMSTEELLTEIFEHLECRDDIKTVEQFVEEFG